MNCQSFEAAITDLARDQMMDAAMRNQALAHAVTCKRCTTRLADEQALTSGLRKMAASAEEAPASVEVSLREAFRAMVLARREPAMTPIASGSHRWLSWAAAAAVIVLVALLALTATRWRNGEAQDPQEKRTEQKEPPMGAPGGVDQKPEQMPQPFAVNNAGRNGGAHRGVRAKRRPSTGKTKPIEPAESRTEIATEFIPLIHGDEMTPLDGGQLVRVELPRSALMSFGLPMNVERAGQRVKADVVVGNDGLARAIRFVH